ncbi:sensor histidine kinase [Fulvivirga sp. M361]|uniref:HAMP domain-containing sensor histidine kinase n=1 Tax=Fulvivirga sp. M361 TaxID=2594266 RepID=UPI00117A8A4D|nr:HAMP domain-containing sensor histidine kinase [Fulvivirga sp. M361]TRX58643.1 sensor histidine kinase [Fulvivirga sp. M361]
MKNSSSSGFFWKIVALFTGLLFVVGFAYVFITVNLAEKYAQERNQRLNADIAKNIIAEVKPYVEGQLDTTATDDIMHHMMAINPSLEVYILDAAGKILNYVAPYKKVKLESVDLVPVEDFIRTDGEKYIEGDDPRNPGQYKVFSAAPIKENNVTIAYIYVVLASEEYVSASEYVLNSYVLKLGGRAILITFLSALLLGILALWLITKNLNKIITIVKKFQSGEMSARIPVKEGGGINDLAITFNDMADTIVGNIENLKSMENLRRELVGNVSHDLRTPLSVIHGYIETLMIKQNQLTDPERDKYLKIILESTHKLKKLVEELFELSKLEAQQVTAQKEPFFIQELIHDLCQKFELLASEKNIVLKTAHNPNKSLVFADVSLIERVLQNLIDNALKFTPENGEISVLVDSSDQYVEIQVSDTGPGIPKEQIPYIFDRYHIGDKRVSLDNKNTGLGLAIVKKILEIHNVTINLSSKLDKGTTFSFQLPQYENS